MIYIVLDNVTNLNDSLQVGDMIYATTPVDSGDLQTSQDPVGAAKIVGILRQIDECEKLPSFEKAGIRKKLFHDPEKTKVAIITCGGLCPGLNNVIKGLVSILEIEYGIKDIFGIRYGYLGLSKKSRYWK